MGQAPPKRCRRVRTTARPHLPTTDLHACGVDVSVQEAGDLLAARLAAAIVEYGRRKAQETFSHDTEPATDASTAG